VTVTVTSFITLTFANGNTALMATAFGENLPNYDAWQKSQ